MSSFTLDASGSRGVNLVLNDPARTYASMPSKPGDSATVNLGGFEEVACYLPATARLELVQIPREDGGEPDEMIRLVVPGPGNSVMLSCLAKDESWPHASISARKIAADAVQDFYFRTKGATVAHSVPVAAAVLAKVEVAGDGPGAEA